MPTSAFTHVPLVCHLVSELRPTSVLDIGIGFGKWGHLFREILDIAEGFPDYITPMHRFLYNEIYVGNMVDVIKEVPTYDVIFIGDVIEHVEKEIGWKFIDDMLAHAKQAVILSTPAYEIQQAGVCGNELEDHKSLWTPGDFRRFPNSIVRVVQSKVLVAALMKPGVAPPRLPSKVKSFARAQLIKTLGEERYKRLGGR